MRKLYLVLTLIPWILSAQINSHYWSHQYGAKGLLLNGAVIASVNDQTSIFYNPAGLAMDTTSGVAFSIMTPSLSIVNNNNFLGEGITTTDRRLSLSPGLVAAVIQPFRSKRVSLGFTTFQRFKARISFRDRVVDRVRNSSDQLYIGSIDFNRNISETWLGVAAGIRIHDRFKIGVSQFLTWRSELVHLNFRKEIIDRIDPNQLVAGWRSDFGYGFSANGGMITKFGLKWTPWNIKIGLTYTTASYALLLRNARYSFDDQQVRSDGSSTVRSNNRSVQLNDYFTPRSIGAGIELPFGRSTVSIATEVFSRIDRYNLIDDVADPLEGLSPNGTGIPVTISQKSDRVINFAIGIERPINSKFTVYHGLRTDFSPNNVLDLGEGVNFLASSPSIFHFSTGFTKTNKKRRLGLGLDYGFGLKTGGQQLTDLSNLTSENIFNFSGKNVVSTYVHQFNLFITYDF